MNLSHILAAIPNGLREPLIKEYNEIVQNYLEHKWTSAELSGGRFSEIVFSILDGYGSANYAPAPFKPASMLAACQGLENNMNLPRSFRILIPRMLPVLYEIRNNRNVGHVGGDVDSNLMDSQAVVQMASWIMGELVRVFHNTTTAGAQKIVDSIASRKLPLVWEVNDVKRVLDSKIKLKEQILLFLSTGTGKVEVEKLVNWTEFTKKYVLDTLRKMHAARFVEVSDGDTMVVILPPGAVLIEKYVAKLSNQ